MEYSEDGEATVKPSRGLPEQTNLSDEGAQSAAAEDGDVPNKWRRKNTIWRMERKSEHLFHQFVENTTLHGVKYVTNPVHSKKRRAIWMALFMTMVVIVSCAIVSHFNEYFAYATKTVISYTTPNQTAFPSVVLCNCNRFRVSALNGSQWEELLPMVVNKGDDRSEQIEKLRSGEFPLNVSDEEERRIKGANYRKLGLALSHEFEDMLLDCRWAGRQRCSAANFSQVWTDFGVCYVFNAEDGPGDGEEGLMADNTGLDGGLWLRLNVEQSEHTSTNTHGSCFMVAIQPRGEISFVREVGRTVRSGYHSVIGLKKHGRTSLESPYDTNCRKDGLKYFNNYSIGACRMECLTDMAMEKCGCIAPFMPESSGFPYCDLVTLITCATHEVGLPYCPCSTPCSEVLYDERVSYSQAPSISVKDEVQQMFNWSREQVLENILEVSIFFEDLREKWTKQEVAYGLTALMSSIGGELGLCLGGSIITVFEFADFLLTREALHWRLFTKKLSRFSQRKQRNHPV
ncbi:acid-sensing ion channel 1-like [Acanthaster planci]|uniref:Acid-sensing ion channel 1-like n=1 Tax=Acanthaster planci TaxID=133434 RepID=A0A8B7XFY4_ACAPL|nr:acid-sensing ion channel 1-like [Acanthaster planci]